MLFNSFDFILFLPIVFALYWFVFKSLRLQNFFVVIASYVFYGWWDFRFLFLIALTSFCSFASGLAIEHYEGRRKHQRFISASNIVLNISILGVFKYYNFFVSNISDLFSVMGYRFDWITLDIILPVGISFYTFQALSYTIDVYQHKLRAERDLIAFLAFVSFFPQLVAGPIERATNLLPQFQKRRHFDYTQAVDGMRQMLWGFFKKMVVADNCAAIVNSYWNQYDDLPGFSLVLLSLFFAFQIYGDFSGYSDIAIGCSRLFGIKLMRNFSFPYFSRDISEFWRKWHISLMTWFRDYIYFPLGGSRCSRFLSMRNTLIVFLISGLWHGAEWTFISWGIYHACLIMLFMLLGWKSKRKAIVGAGRFLPSLKETGQMVLVFVLVVIGWILFRAENLSQAVGFFVAMIRNPFYDTFLIPNNTMFCAFWCFVLVITEWLQREKQHALQMENSKFFSYRFVRWATYYVIFYVIIRYNGIGQNFIYFQF